MAIPEIDFTQIPIEDQVAAVDREIRQRQRVYGRLIDRNKMSLKEAQKQIANMRAVRATLEKAQAPGRLFR